MVFLAFYIKMMIKYIYTQEAMAIQAEMYLMLLIHYLVNNN